MVGKPCPQRDSRQFQSCLHGPVDLLLDCPGQVRDNSQDALLPDRRRLPHLIREGPCSPLPAPSAVAGSTSTFVARPASARFPVIMARIVFANAWLSASFCTTTAGRTFAAGHVLERKVGEDDSAALHGASRA